MKKNSSIIQLVVFCIVLFAGSSAGSEVLWEQNWNSVPDFQSAYGSISGIQTTREQANVWNCSSYRTGGRSPVGMIEVTSSEDRNGSGKSVGYKLVGTAAFMGGSIDLIFDDPNVAWKNGASHKSDGYDELYYGVALKTPVDIDWTTGGSFIMWKPARFFAYNPNSPVPPRVGKTEPVYTTPPSYANLLAGNENPSSHYFYESSGVNKCDNYKHTYFIPSFSSPYMYWYPRYNTDNAATGDDGCSTQYPLGVSDSRSDTYLPSVLNDNKWHWIEYHVKLNDIGSANGVCELFVDGTKISPAASGFEMRSTPNSKFMVINLFDNYSKGNTSGTQTIYLDDMVVSTTYIGEDYRIEDTAKIVPGVPTNFK